MLQNARAGLHHYMVALQNYHFLAVAREFFVHFATERFNGCGFGECRYEHVGECIRMTAASHCTMYGSYNKLQKDIRARATHSNPK